MAGSFPTGRFIWYECMAADEAGAKEFYVPVVGWTAQAWEDGPMPYTMWMKGEKPVGGLMKLPEEAAAMGAPPHWLGYIATPGVEDTVKKAQELGGVLLSEILTLPTVGVIAILQDPQGAVFAAFTPENDSSADYVPSGDLEFHWNELATSDLEGGFKFYQALFGWEKKDSMDMGEAGTYQMYGRPDDDFPLGGMYNKPPEMPAPPNWLYYVTVPDINAAVEAVKTQGGQVFNGPMEVPGGDLVAQCMDPQGAAFALHALAKKG
jgi:predicted enzyme related to lactoylglutathione lyase